MTRTNALSRAARSLPHSVPLCLCLAVLGCDPAPVEGSDTGAFAADTGAIEAVPGAAALAEAESILGEGSWSLTGPECGALASFARVEVLTDEGVEVRLMASDEALSCADYNAAERERENIQLMRSIAAEAGDVEAQCEVVRETLYREMWAEAALQPSGSCTLTLDPRGASPPTLELGSPARLGLMAAALDDCAEMPDAGALFDALADAMAAAHAAMPPEVIAFERAAKPTLKVGADLTGVNLQGRPRRPVESKPALSVRGLAETCVVDLRD